MKSSKNIILVMAFTLMTGCGSGRSGGSGGGVAPPNNMLSITVNGSLCSTGSYFNKPCVSVTVCTSGSSACQTISDILLDTGSSGLRIFKQALNVSLAQAVVGTGLIAECTQFGDGSSDWGPVQTASVILGNEPPVQVPIQVIDAAFAAAPATCQNADQNPTAAGFNGILGIGVFSQDCGLACASSANNGIYYSCDGSNCVGAAVALSMQVQNPVSLLPRDNNGVLVQLPIVSPGGSPFVNGNLVIGIGTQSNNVPSGATAYAADQNGEITTILNGISYSGIIDSGSNGLFFTPPSASLLPDCPSPYSGWFCPSSTTTLSATNTGASGSAHGAVSFQIGNFGNLIGSTNNVFADVGGPASGQVDWGLPFFLGRNVYVGIDGKESSLGIGPYWGY